jgi:hypothetical protein
LNTDCDGVGVGVFVLVGVGVGVGDGIHEPPVIILISGSLNGALHEQISYITPQLSLMVCIVPKLQFVNDTDPNDSHEPVYCN